MKILTNKIWWNKINILSLYSKLNIMKKNVGSEIISEEFVNLTKQVNESFPSIFTKEDVTRLLIELEQRIVSHETEEGEVSTPNDFDVKELVQRIKDRVVEAIEEYDFDDNLNFDISYNRQIEVSVETDVLQKICKSEIDETLEDYLEEIEEQNEVEVED